MNINLENKEVQERLQNYVLLAKRITERIQGDSSHIDQSTPDDVP